MPKFTKEDILAAREAEKNPRLKQVASADAEINQFEMIELKQLDQICLKANKENKYIIILDHTDRAADFFSYKAI